MGPLCSNGIKKNEAALNTKMLIMFKMWMNYIKNSTLNTKRSKSNVHNVDKNTVTIN